MKTKITLALGLLLAGAMTFQSCGGNKADSQDEQITYVRIVVDDQGMFDEEEYTFEELLQAVNFYFYREPDEASAKLMQVSAYPEFVLGWSDELPAGSECLDMYCPSNLDALVVLDSVEGWVKLALDNGYEGWLPSSRVSVLNRVEYTVEQDVRCGAGMGIRTEGDYAGYTMARDVNSGLYMLRYVVDGKEQLRKGLSFDLRQDPAATTLQMEQTSDSSWTLTSDHALVSQMFSFSPRVFDITLMSDEEMRLFVETVYKDVPVVEEVYHFVDPNDPPCEDGYVYDITYRKQL